jgi:hypothetical protein
MRTKSAYREPENIPEELPEALRAPSDDPPVIAAAEVETPQPESNSEAAVEAEQAAAVADEAARALQQQIEAARQAETLQAEHQQAAMMAPVTREEKLHAWGLSEAEKKFLADRPEMIDQDRILAAAIATTTRAGVGRDDPTFLSKVEQNFGRFQRQAAEQSPAFFRPETPRTPSRPTPASYTSAPVSREVPGAERPLSLPTKINLSFEEKEAARIAGVSEVEYAVQKRRLLLEKASGSRQT